MASSPSPLAPFGSFFHPPKWAKSVLTHSAPVAILRPLHKQTTNSISQKLRETDTRPQTQHQQQDVRPPRPTEEVLKPVGVVTAPQTAEASSIGPSSSTSSAVPLVPFPPKPVSVAAAAAQQPAQPQPQARAAGAGQEKGETVRFSMPKIKGLPVDYCSRYQHAGVRGGSRGIDCGLPAATRFCRSQGFDGSTGDYIVTYYSNRATFTMADASIHPADPPGDGKGKHTWFTSITCRSSGHTRGEVTADFTVGPMAGEGEGEDGGLNRF